MTTDSLRQVCREHGDLFVSLVLKKYRFSSLEKVPAVHTRAAHALSPIIIQDYRAITGVEKAHLAEAYASLYGAAYFIVKNPLAPSEHAHPLFDIMSQLNGVMPAAYPLRHPMEGHPDSITHCGPPDGTVKIYDLPGKGGEAGYREQAETNEVFDVHHDGLGSGGTVQTVILYMDSAPMVGGYTYFLNVPLLALCLAKADPEAFQSLFLPDALTIIRPRGKGAIKVTTPVLFVNDADLPQSFFRVASGEYEVSWSTDDSLSRAKNFLENFVPPFSPGSSFVHLDGRGHGCIMDNQYVAHGRTEFTDDPARGLKRVLSRKWFMRSPRDEKYKHVPGMFVCKRFANPYSKISDSVILEGEWQYERGRDENVRVA